MREIEVREFLGAYACGTLTPVEERALHNAVLDDQELFNALAEEDLLREAMADESFRRELKYRLEELNRDESARTVVSDWTRWFRRPAMILGCGLGAVILAVGVRLLFESGSPGGPADSVKPAGAAQWGKRPSRRDGVCGYPKDPRRIPGAALGPGTNWPKGWNRAGFGPRGTGAAV